MVKKKVTKKTPVSTTLTLRFDLRTIVWALVALNILTLFLWKPWQSSGAADRTISVSGEAIIEAQPDRFVFNPSYELSADTQDAVLSLATKKANTVVDGLKALGIDDKDIKLDTSSYGQLWYDESNDENKTSVYITVDIDDKDLAQKVQDYLLTTGPEGQITPRYSFTEAKQDELEQQAREKAIADAKSKAEQSAQQLNLRVGKVISVNEGYGFGGIDVAYAETASRDGDSNVTVTSSLPIQPGENEYNFNVTVVFEIK